MSAPPVDLVVGLLSHNHARTIRGSAGAIRDGVTRLRGITHQIVWADSGSTDATAATLRKTMAGAAVMEVPAHPSMDHLLERPYHGIPGKARALHGVLEAARSLEARACVIVDAGAPVAPHWVDGLAGPLLADDMDFVSPYYSRAPHQGALTKGVVYPLVRALYGVRLREPAAAEFGCSRRFLERALEEDLWEADGAQASIDVWLTTSAASSEYRLSEVALGVRGRAAHGDDTPDLATTLRQVVGALFADLDGRVDRWQRVRGSVAVRAYDQAGPATPGEGPPADVEGLIESYRLGYRELRDIWTWALPPRTIVELRKLLDVPPAAFDLPDNLWAHIVYDFALAYRLRVLPRDHLLGSLVPLYLGWLASFVLQVQHAAPEAVDERVERLAMIFEGQKPHLIAKWRWPERLRS